MATNSCVKYPFCMEWTMQIPSENIPIRSELFESRRCRSHNIILLEGMECNLELTSYEEDYFLDIVVQKGEYEVLKKFTITTFIRDFSDGQRKLIAYCELSSLPIFYKTTLFRMSKSAVLAKIPSILNYRELTIICVFHSTDTRLDKNPSVHVSRQTTLDSVHLHSLSRDFSTLLKDETFSDVKLICGDRTFSANTSVLAARSEVFAAMFRNKMAEVKTGVVHIKDVDPELLELLLKYFYYAEIPDLCEETAHRLYEAADKYAVHGLRRACSDWMVEGQTTDNCLDLLVLGDKHSDENFKEAVASFVAEHLPGLSVESWTTFSDKYPQLVFAVLKKRCEDSMPGAVKGAK